MLRETIDPVGLLAVCTSDATSIIRVGRLVIKHHRETHYEPIWRQPGEWPRQVAKRIAFSRDPPDLGPRFLINPILFWSWPFTFSAFVPGRWATWPEALEFQAALNAAGFGIVQDVAPTNVIATGSAFVLIDFEVIDQPCDRRLGVLKAVDV